MAGFFIVIGALLMLGAGGCSLLVLGSYGPNDGGIILIFGGIPFAIGAFIFWLAKAANQAASLAAPKEPPVNPEDQPKKPPPSQFWPAPKRPKGD